MCCLCAACVLPVCCLCATCVLVGDEATKPIVEGEAYGSTFLFGAPVLVVLSYFGLLVWYGMPRCVQATGKLKTLERNLTASRGCVRVLSGKISRLWLRDSFEKLSCFVRKEVYRSACMEKRVLSRGEATGTKSRTSSSPIKFESCWREPS